MIPDDEKLSLLQRLQDARDTVVVTKLLRKASCRYSPSELAKVYDAVNFDDLQVPKAEFIRSAPMWGLLRNKELPVLNSTAISSNAVFHEAPQRPKAEKCLLVCLCGIKGELFLPPSRFMLELPEGAYDFLVLSPRRVMPSKELAHYTSGVPGYGGNLQEIADRIIREIEPEAYRSSAVIGSSLGGFAAIDLADLAGADVGISISGRMEYIGGIVPTEILMQTPPAKLCECRQWRGGTIFHAFFGTGNKQDMESAGQLFRINGGITLWPIAGLENHNPFPFLAAHRQLKGFFEGLARATLDREPKPWAPFD